MPKDSPKKRPKTVTVTLRDRTRLTLVQPDSEHLISVLRASVTASGVSQFALAKVSGVAQAAISQFMNGAGLNLESASRIATVLGLELVQNPERAPRRVEPES